MHNQDYLLLYKSIHVISVIAWMAAIFYLPRLFVYHTSVRPGSKTDKKFQIMEKRLLSIIMNPAMIATYVFGFLTSISYGHTVLSSWFYIKMLAVLGLTIIHLLCMKWVKDFAICSNRHTEKFYRIVNEAPTILMALSVFMVIMKPFE